MRSEALKKALRQALRKRLVLAVVVGGLVFATAYAFAATLSITSKTLGAGNSAVAACTSNTLQASYALTFQGGTGNTIGTAAAPWTYSVGSGNIVSGAVGAPWAAGQYYVSTITVTSTTGDLVSCASKLLTLDVLGASNADLAQYTATLPAAPGTSWTFGATAPSGGTAVGQAIPVANAVPASVVQGIAIAISG